MERSGRETLDSRMKFDSTHIMYTCVCGKKVLHYLHYLHLFSPASVPSRTYIGIDSRYVRIGLHRYTCGATSIYV